MCGLLWGKEDGKGAILIKGGIEAMKGGVGWCWRMGRVGVD